MILVTGHFVKTFDLIVMGRKSQDQIFDFGEWPYQEKHSKVFTYQFPEENPHSIEFVEGNVMRYFNFFNIVRIG